MYRIIGMIIVMFSFNYILAYNFEITSKSAIVCDFNSDNILYSKDINKRIYPASTTKILTAILAIEKLDLNQIATVSQKALSLVPPNSSSMNLKVGETLTVKDLLHGLLLVSGGDAANVLAETVSGTNEEFIILLNEKLKELKCTNSNFVNAHGFHDKNHYTTCVDMSKILKYAFKNEILKEICNTKEYNYLGKNLTSTNSLLDENDTYLIIGKTGYTSEAGNVFVSYSKYNEKEFIACIYDGNKNILNKQIRFIETKKLYEYCFNNYYSKQIISKDKFKTSFIDKNTKKIYELGFNNDISCLTDNNIYKLEYKLNNISNFDNTSISIRVSNNNFDFNDDLKLSLKNTTTYKDKNYKLNYYYTIPIGTIIISLLLILFNRQPKINNIKRKKE